eukprot:2367200-Alexandrium_andersonii.AAC.1
MCIRDRFSPAPAAKKRPAAAAEPQGMFIGKARDNVNYEDWQRSVITKSRLVHGKSPARAYIQVQNKGANATMQFCFMRS